MSACRGACVGVGWLVDDSARLKMLNHIVNTERRNEISDHFFRYSVKNKWFFGDIVYELPEGEAKSIETLAALPVLQDDSSFGLKFGMILVDCGLSVDEINEYWSIPNIYFIHWCDC